MVSEGKDSLKDQGDGISIHLSKCFSPGQGFIAVKKTPWSWQLLQRKTFDWG